MSEPAGTPRKSAVELFRILADCYHQPDDELKDRIKGVAEMATPLGDIPEAMARKLVGYLEEGALDTLLVDFARLFVGPFELAAPPFGSVYLEDGHKLMGDSTMDVKQYYRAAGLEISDDFANPPDHIAAELEFLYYLYIREAALSEDDAEAIEEIGKLRKEFLSRHLGAWGVQFAERVRDNATTDFYQTLGGLTKAVLENETMRSMD